MVLRILEGLDIQEGRRQLSLSFELLGLHLLIRFCKMRAVCAVGLSRAMCVAGVHALLNNSFPKFLGGVKGLGLNPAYIPLGSADTEGLLKPLSLLRVPQSDYNDIMRALKSTQGVGNWHNLVPAKVFWWYNKKDPLEHAKGIKAPVLLIAGREDTLVPEWAVREAGKRIGDLATTITLDGSHESLYSNKELIPRRKKARNDLAGQKDHDGNLPPIGSFSIDEVCLLSDNIDLA
eukprot:scaffold25448_cov18-Tisochrysis_lutea.AAC.4